MSDEIIQAVKAGLERAQERGFDAGYQQCMADQKAQPPADSLREFALWAIRQASEEGADLCGGDVQDQAHALGLLHRVQVTEPCGEHCACAELGDWPADCYRYSSILTGQQGGPQS